MPDVLYVAERRTSAFQMARLSVDVVCAGDSITGWNNFGVVRDWPYRTYPEFLQSLCDSLGMTVANGGIAGEVSANGLGQVEDYLGLFPNARCFVVGYGTDDLGMWPEVGRTSSRIIENLDRRVRSGSILQAQEGSWSIDDHAAYCNPHGAPWTINPGSHRIDATNNSPGGMAHDRG
jgi:hypothetical protein